MARIFISGVAGLLGSHMADAFIKEGHEVVGCDSLIGGYEDNVHPDVEFYTYDCNFRNSMLKITKDVDVIYHCAALAHEGLSVFSPHVVSLNVYQNTVSLLSAAIANKVKRFVFCSSMARYGTQDELPFRETMTPRPQDPYAVAKWAAEMQVQLLCEVHGIEWVIAVPHNIIGPRQKYDDPFRNVASIMINRMLQGKQPIIYGDGNQKRCFSFINDVVDVLKELAFNPKAKNQIFNVGPDDEFVSINELAETLADLLDFKLDPIYVDPRPQEVLHANCSADKIRQHFDFKQKYTLRQGLQEMIDYIKTRGVRPFRYHIDIEIRNEKTPKTWSQKLI